MFKHCGLTGELNKGFRDQVPLPLPRCRANAAAAIGVAETLSTSTELCRTHLISERGRGDGVEMLDRFLEGKPINIVY